MIAFLKKWKKWLVGLFAVAAIGGATADQLDTIPASLENKDIVGCGASYGQAIDPETKDFTIFLNGCNKTFKLSNSEFKSIDTFISRRTKKEVAEEYILERYGIHMELELDKNGDIYNVTTYW